MGLKIKSIKPVGKRKVADITVDDNHQYILANKVISSNTGIMYGADSVFIIGKSQSKGTTSATSKELLGYNFTIRVDKSRFIKEGSRIPITVHYEHIDSEGVEHNGIMKYSGLLEIAKSIGYIESCRIGRAGGWKLKIDNPESLGITEDITVLTTDVLTSSKFWDAVFKYTDLQDVIEAMYMIPVSLSANEEAILDNVNKDDIEDFVS